ncbi:MAG: 2OG-Fe(II) oxygenase [Cyclobacteriaceae bacterium]|nr:2OG-Fe(II) oxygenase [Cyclobacteriaceae bacterium HetDA_MAG_MS6]
MRTTNLPKEVRNFPSKLENYPVPHFYIKDFFTEEFHDQLCQVFNQTLSKGLNEQLAKDKFSRFGGYDAYCFLLPPDSVYPLNFFYSIEWHSLFEDLFDLPITNDVVAEFHHHQVKSNRGFVHNDYNICCFTEAPLENGINPWYYHCNFDPRYNDMSSGQIKERMRSIAILYYLNNEEWLPEDGGETGLFINATDERPIKTFPPISNSLFAFEITPESYHAFLSNVRLERNSVIMWFHTDKEIKIRRHHNTPPVPYQ